jgi:beta-galactosidase
MKAIQFNDNWCWKRLEEDGPGAPVTLPHDAMLYEPRSALSAGGVNTGWYEGHDYLYTKTFTPDGALAGQTAVLEFEGVYHNAEVRLNGEKLAFRPYGYTNFYVELTGKLHAHEENTLEVIARNADQPNSRWYSGAGIYRPVRLWTAPEQHIKLNGLRVRTVSINPAVVEVTVLTQGSGEVFVQICQEGQAVVSGRADSNGKAVLQLEIPDGRLWSPDAPNLYTCRAIFGEDSEETAFGLRTLEWGPRGFLLNGERTIIQGACIHHDNGVLGACCYEDAEWRKIRILKENGYNAVRSAHNPCSKFLLDACDHLGVLVMDEYIDHWYIHKTIHDYVEYFPQWWKQDMKDMVDKDYNHPCVVMYSSGNEVGETAQEKGITLAGEMTDYLHSLDDTRPVTCGVNIFFNFLTSIGVGQYSDEKAKKEAERAEQARASGKQVKESSVGSKFFNDMAGLLGDEFMKRMATLPMCDAATNKAFANMDIAGYNYGIYRYKHDLKKYPNRLILGSETFCNDAYKFRELAKTEPRLIGDFVWAGMDYLGEVGVGSWEYADYAPRFDGGLGWVSAGSGRIDLTGRPLGEMYYTRVALEQEKGPYIVVCPVNHTGDKHSPSAWKMSNAIPSWSWRGCGGKTANVEVYARAHSVELLVNGKSVGKKDLKRDCIAKFRCAYEDGTVTAVSYDNRGTEIGRCTLRTASPETQLRAVSEEDTVAPGQLCHIRLQYTDENGTIKPLERGILSVEVTGGRLLGLGSACPFNEIGFVTSRTDTYYGEALAVVKVGKGKEFILSVTDGRHTGKAFIPVIAKNNNHE